MARREKEKEGYGETDETCCSFKARIAGSICHSTILRLIDRDWLKIREGFRLSIEIADPSVCFYCIFFR